MRRSGLFLAIFLSIVLMLAGCGSSGSEAEDDATTGTSAAATSSTAAPTSEPTSTSGASDEPTTTSETSDSAQAEWKTVATLRSDAAPWQDMEGILMSDPFMVEGEVQVVLDMPDAGELDGVIAVIIPANVATDTISLMSAIQDGAAMTLIPAAPVQTFADLSGEYVLVNAVPGTTAWSLEVQTKP